MIQKLWGLIGFLSPSIRLLRRLLSLTMLTLHYISKKAKNRDANIVRLSDFLSDQISL